MSYEPHPAATTVKGEERPAESPEWWNGPSTTLGGSKPAYNPDDTNKEQTIKQYEVRKGSRVVVITEDGTTRFNARLYLNHGETASLQAWKGKTLQGAKAWATRMLAS